MTTKQAIQEQIDRLDEEDLVDLYALIEQFIASRRGKRQPSLMESLRAIKIDGPEDFSSNLDLYLSGEKRVEPNPR
jgi:hypothetical protein